MNKWTEEQTKEAFKGFKKLKTPAESVKLVAQLKKTAEMCLDWGASVSPNPRLPSF